jgi:hypothetical protein
MASNAVHSSRTAPDPPRLAGEFAIVVGPGSASGGTGSDHSSFDGALLAASAAIRAFAAKHCHRQVANTIAAPSLDSYLGTASIMRDVCSFWSEAPLGDASGVSLFVRDMCSAFRMRFLTRGLHYTWFIF